MFRQFNQGEEVKEGMILKPTVGTEREKNKWFLVVKILNPEKNINERICKLIELGQIDNQSESLDSTLKGNYLIKEED